MELKLVNKFFFNIKVYWVIFKFFKNKFNFIYRENQEEYFICIFKFFGLVIIKEIIQYLFFVDFLSFFVVLCVFNINDNVCVV